MNRRVQAFSILEVVIALAIFLLILTMLGSYASFSVANLARGQGELAAEALAQEADSLVRSVARRDWSELNTDVGSLQFESGVWKLASRGNFEQLQQYQRRLELASICRDANHLVVDCQLGTIDPDSYQLNILINWSDWQGGHTLQRKTYLSNWR